MQTVLMTGATGFLGSRLLERLLTESASLQVTALVRASSNRQRLMPWVPRLNVAVSGQDDLAALFAAKRFDAIIHCATEYGRTGSTAEAINDTNVQLPLRLLELGQAHGLSTFVNVDTLLPPEVSVYSQSKRQWRELLRAAGSDLTVINLAIEHFYGPGEDPGKFIPWLLRNLLGGVPSINLTAGQQIRDFVYVDDAVNAVATILAARASQGSGFHAFEIGTGNLTSVADMVRLAKMLTRNQCTQLNFGALPYRPNEPMEIRADIAALAALGWRSQWSLERGLQATIEFERTRGS